jgi:outer membrane protein TolC
MIDDAALRRVEQAEARLERARRRLRTEQAAAVFGDGAPGALDAAILAHRRAEAEAAAARAALKQRSGGDRGPGPGVAPARPSEEPSPRLRFARWLVQTGRLSDWGGPSDGRAA